MRWRDAVWLAAALTLVAACASSPNPSRPIDPSPDSTIEPSGPPAGEPVRFETIVLSPDRSSVTVSFVGAKAFDPTDPCSAHYFGWAREVEGVLQVKVVDDTPRQPGATPQACDLVGFTRTITIDLARPYAGWRAKDLAGDMHFVSRPPGSVELTTLPSGWILQLERDVEESTTGRWQRTWTQGGSLNVQSSKGRIDLYQAFGGPADVSGGEEIRSVLVNGRGATLYRSAPDGELVLVWKLGEDGLALVVSESDFKIAEAIKLAEGAHFP
jgi:hypothetical protein